jgi:pimeloyl-ACP methyl ester carboxylesterase
MDGMPLRISEQAVLLGQRQSLVGVLTRAVAEMPADGSAVVILNTGIIHRVGHHRMFVTMSRALARAGHTVLRFDFSGIGDSDPRNDGLSPLASCMADIKDALDWLERNCQASRVILVGLCSGADHAVLYGHSDDRVAALVLMDPTIPATFRYYVHFIGRRVTRLRSWVRVVTGRSRAARIWLGQASHIVWPWQKSRPVMMPSSINHGKIAGHYQKTVDKNISMLAIFTDDTTRQTYRGQIFDALPNVSFGDKLTLELFHGSDHTFILESDRSRLIRLIVEWVESLRPSRSARVLPAAASIPA